MFVFHVRHLVHDIYQSRRRDLRVATRFFQRATWPSIFPPPSCARINKWRLLWENRREERGWGTLGFKLANRQSGFMIFSHRPVSSNREGARCLWSAAFRDPFLPPMATVFSVTSSLRPSRLPPFSLPFRDFGGPLKSRMQSYEDEWRDILGESGLSWWILKHSFLRLVVASVNYRWFINGSQSFIESFVELFKVLYFSKRNFRDRI